MVVGEVVADPGGVDNAVRKVRDSGVRINRYQFLRDFCCCLTSRTCRASNRWFWKKQSRLRRNRHQGSNKGTIDLTNEIGASERMMNEGFHY
jgi:hypothetical protein